MYSAWLNFKDFECKGIKGAYILYVGLEFSCNGCSAGLQRSICSGKTFEFSLSRRKIEGFAGIIELCEAIYSHKWTLLRRVFAIFPTLQSGFISAAIMRAAVHSV